MPLYELMVHKQATTKKVSKYANIFYTIYAKTHAYTK